MKMTRLEWRYLQKVALDHPYFDTHELPMTEKEAKTIVKENIKMTGREFVDSIYAKLGMTRPEEKKDHFAWLHSIGELFTVPPIRKIAIAVLVVVLMTVFFAATPAGRAIAESVIQYIATLFEDGRLIISHNKVTSVFMEREDVTFDGEQDETDDTASYVLLNTFDDFTKETGKTPVVLPLQYTALYYEYDALIDCLSLCVTYNKSGRVIITNQIWNAEELVCSTSTGFIPYGTNESIYYSIERDGRIIIKKLLEDSIIEINAVEGYTLNELIEMLD